MKNGKKKTMTNIHTYTRKYHRSTSQSTGSDPFLTVKACYDAITLGFDTSICKYKQILAKKSLIIQFSEQKLKG